jgi:prepilin-type N-terminal cleavage/methylation domain-containing protein
MSLPIHRSPAGFTLIETVVATTLIAIAVAALAQLITLGTRQSTTNRRALETTVAAQSKLEELRALPWTFSVENLSPSPPDVLRSDVAGFFDTADLLTRRWAIVAVAGDPNARTISVCAHRARGGPPAETCVTTVRVRRP